MYLIIILGDNLRCFLDNKLNPRGLTINNIHYGNEEGGDWTGFYDFLRKPEAGVIGIRYFHLDHDPRLLRAVENKPYVRLLPTGAMELYFFSDRSYVPELSADQDFGENMLLRSASGEYAITFGLGSLKPAEVSQVEKLSERVEH
jgi:hypothetical protein